MSGFKRSGSPRRNFSSLTGPEKIDSLIRRKKYYKDRQQQIRRLVDVNYDPSSSFLTLTQRADISTNRDVRDSNYNFDKFIRRLKYYLKKHYKRDLKYIATWERTKKGVIHYHLILFSFPFIPAKKLEEIWGLGFIKINKLNDVDFNKRGLYVSKYFTKDLELRDRKNKAYFSSRNLKKPQEIKTYFSKDKFSADDFGKLDYHKEYNYFLSDYINKIDYYAVKKGDEDNN